MQFGALHQKASDLRVKEWIDGDGNPREPLSLSELGDGYKVLFAFQDWCPGCHSRGFPTMKYLYDNLKDKNFGFAVIQTVFEGASRNTSDKLRENQVKYDLPIPFGHDLPDAGQRHPSFMEDYRSGGTPWFTIIDPQGTVVYSDFHIDPNRLLAALGAETADMESK